MKMQSEKPAQMSKFERPALRKLASEQSFESNEKMTEVKQARYSPEKEKPVHVHRSSLKPSLIG